MSRVLNNAYLVGLGVGLDLGDGDTTVLVGVDVDHLGVSLDSPPRYVNDHSGPAE